MMVGKSKEKRPQFIYTTLNDMKYENAANKTETVGAKTMGSKIIIPKKMKTKKDSRFHSGRII